MVLIRRNEGNWRAYLACGGLVLGFALSPICSAICQPKPDTKGTHDAQKGAPQQSPMAPHAVTQELPAMPFIYPNGCTRRENDNQENLCIEGRAADAAERSAFWAALTFVISLGGILGVVGTLGYTARAANAAKKAAEVAEKALTDLERPFVCAVVSKPGITWKARAERFETEVDFSLSDMELSICNYGRTPAVLTRLVWEVTTAQAGYNCVAIDSATIGGREMPANTISVKEAPYTEVGNPYGIVWHGREQISRLERVIWMVGFVRYSDILGGHTVVGFAMAFDFEIGRFIVTGGERHNYIRKEDERDIPAPSRSILAPHTTLSPPQT